MIPTTRNSGLRLQLSGADVGGLRFLGELPGLVVLAVAARNGTGSGRLIASDLGVAWQAPGSTTPGPPCAIPADGNYLLEDGADPSCWINVAAHVAFLATSGEAQIGLADRYNNLGPSDVAATDAAAGLVTTTEYTLKNVSIYPVINARLWIDATASGAAALTVSSDGTNFFDPTSSTDTHVLAWASIAAGASVNVWVKRTIAAASASNPKILNLLQFQWQSYP